MMFDLAKKLFPICRSITGKGVRQTFDILKKYQPKLKTIEIPTGTECFDWKIPREWNIEDAYLIDPDGKKILRFKDNNLHILNYSTPIDVEIDLEDLKKHLHTLPKQPKAIPYLTSYYEERWGFCLSYEDYLKLKPGKYRAVIKSTLNEGSMTLGDIFYKGRSEKEILFSTYICHPSLANNEISGPVVNTFLAKHIENLRGDHNYSYRFVFVPETIGAIAYLSKNLQIMKKRTIAGFQVTCVGDNNNYSYIASPSGNNYADRVAKYCLEQYVGSFKEYSFLKRGSDERQYCSPNINLPVCSISRTKYGEYPEYHTSLDNLDFISEEGLQGALNIYLKVIKTLEINETYKNICYAEPFLSKRGLRTTLGGQKVFKENINGLSNLIAYTDGKKDLIEICSICGLDIEWAKEMSNRLIQFGIFSKI